MASNEHDSRRAYKYRGYSNSSNNHSNNSGRNIRRISYQHASQSQEEYTNPPSEAADEPRSYFAAARHPPAQHRSGNYQQQSSYPQPQYNCDAWASYGTSERPSPSVQHNASVVSNPVAVNQEILSGPSVSAYQSRNHSAIVSQVPMSSSFSNSSISVPPSTPVSLANMVGSALSNVGQQPIINLIDPNSFNLAAAAASAPFGSFYGGQLQTPLTGSSLSVGGMSLYPYMDPMMTSALAFQQQQKHQQQLAAVASMNSSYQQYCNLLYDAIMSTFPRSINQVVPTQTPFGLLPPPWMVYNMSISNTSTAAMANYFPPMTPAGHYYNNIAPPPPSIFTLMPLRI